MHKLLLNLPTRLESERLSLRSYQAGDGPLCYAISQRNRAHLLRFEAGNSLMSIQSEEDAEIMARQFAIDWAARIHFFLAAFDKTSGQFVAQIYIGVVDWNLPEFEIGYIADCEHEGRGFVSEGVRAVLGFAFNHLHAARLRIECDDSNLRSIHVAERCGFTREGHLRENKRHADGSISGTLHFGLLRREFVGL